MTTPASDVVNEAVETVVATLLPRLAAADIKWEEIVLYADQHSPQAEHRADLWVRRGRGGRRVSIEAPDFLEAVIRWHAAWNGAEQAASAMISIRAISKDRVASRAVVSDSLLDIAATGAAPSAVRSWGKRLLGASAMLWRDQPADDPSEPRGESPQ